MSKLVSTLFGGTDDSAQRAQSRQNEQARELIARQAEQARGDILNLFPIGTANRSLGFQAALGQIGSGITGQSGVFGAGNVGAQQALLAGLPQIQNAILGQNVDLSGLQAVNLQPDLSAFTNVQLPEFQSPTAALNQPPTAADILASLRGGLR